MRLLIGSNFPEWRGAHLCCAPNAPENRFRADQSREPDGRAAPPLQKSGGGDVDLYEDVAAPTTHQEAGFGAVVL